MDHNIDGFEVQILTESMSILSPLSGQTAGTTFGTETGQKSIGKQFAQTLSVEN